MAGEIVSANVAEAIVKLVAVEALPALEGNLVMAGLVNRNYEGMFQGQVGDVLNIPIPGVMVANNIAEAGAVVNQNPSLGSAALVLNTHLEATFTIPDVVKMIVAPDLLPLYMNPALIAMAEKVEGDLMGLYSSLTFNTAVGTGNSALTEATLDNAETTLFNAKVPPSEQRHLVTSGTGYSQLRQIPRFSEVQTSNNGNAINSGVVGTLKDFQIHRSQYIKKPSTTTFGMGFTRNCFALAVRTLPQALPGTGVVQAIISSRGLGLRVTMSYSPSTLGQVFTVDMLYGVGVLRREFGVQVLN